MPHSSCDPCCDPTGNSRGVDQYRSSVVQVLCASLAVLEEILIAIVGGGGQPTEAVFTTAVKFDATTLTGTFQPIATPDQDLKILKIENFGDQRVAGSFNGVDIQDYWSPNKVYTYDFRTNLSKLSTPIEAKTDGATPGSGSVILVTMIGG